MKKIKDKELPNNIELLNNIFEAPSAMDFRLGRSVKDRIWVALYQSMKSDIKNGRKYISIFNLVDFYNLCKGDLIKSKKDKYKSIKAALKKLIEEGDVVKVNRKGNPWKSKDEEPWYHFRTDMENTGFPDDYWIWEYKKNIKQNKFITGLYNLSFGTNYSPVDLDILRSKITDDMLYEDSGFKHFLDFSIAVHSLIDIFRRPDMRRPVVEQICWGMIEPKVSVSYFPGPAATDEIYQEGLKKIIGKMKNDGGDNKIR